MTLRKPNAHIVIKRTAYITPAVMMSFNKVGLSLHRNDVRMLRPEGDQKRGDQKRSINLVI